MIDRDLQEHVKYMWPKDGLRLEIVYSAQFRTQML